MMNLRRLTQASPAMASCRKSLNSGKIYCLHITSGPKLRNPPGAVMAQVCDICGKKPQFGNVISHAHNVSRRRWNVNLRPVRAKVKGATKRLRVCTACLRSGKVVKA